MYERVSSIHMYANIDTRVMDIIIHTTEHGMKLPMPNTNQTMIWLIIWNENMRQKEPKLWKTEKRGSALIEQHIM